MKDSEISNIFTFHPVKGDQADRYAKMREMAREFALHINAVCPDSREKSMAITSLQQTVMWANASIAIHE